MFCARAMTLDALPRWNSGTLSAKLAVRVARTAFAATCATTHAKVSCSTFGEKASQASATTKTTTPMTIHGRRRPQRVRVRSDSAPASGFASRAPSAPNGRTEPTIVSGLVGLSTVALIDMLTKTGVSSAAKRPNCARLSAHMYPAPTRMVLTDCVMPSTENARDAAAGSVLVAPAAAVTGGLAVPASPVWGSSFDVGVDMTPPRVIGGARPSEYLVLLGEAEASTENLATKGFCLQASRQTAKRNVGGSSQRDVAARNRPRCVLRGGGSGAPQLRMTAAGSSRIRRSRVRQSARASVSGASSRRPRGGPGAARSSGRSGSGCRGTSGR